MNNISAKIVSIIFGVAVVSGSFLAVFGPSLKNLKVDNTATYSENSNLPSGNTSVNPKSNTAAPGNSTNNYSDDDDSDDDSDDGSTPIVNNPAPAPSNTSTGATTPQVTSYSLTQVSSHNSATSCWSAVNGQVYDLTSWVNAHPGGAAAILMICGKDGSALFNMQHGGQGKPANILLKYKIGALK